MSEDTISQTKESKNSARPAGCKAAKAVWHKNIRIVRFDQTVRAFHQTKCEFELFSCIGKVSQVEATINFVFCRLVEFSFYDFSNNPT